MKLDSPLNEAHIELFVSTIHGHIVSRLKDLAECRVQKAFKGKDEARNSVSPSLESIHTTLPNEIISKIVALASETTQLPHGLSHPMSSIRADDWVAHRLDPSIPATVHVDTRTITEKSLRQILLCNGINLAVRTKYAPGSSILSLLLKYPRRWKCLDLEMEMYNDKHFSFLDKFTSAIPYLEEISISFVDGNFVRPSIPKGSQASLLKWETATKLKKATLSLSLLKTFLLHDSLRSLTILTIHFNPDSDLELMKLLSSLPSLEELALCYQQLKFNSGEEMLVPDSRSKGPILCPRLRSICFDASICKFLTQYLSLFKSTNIMKLKLGPQRWGSEVELTYDYARAIQEAFPGLSELTINFENVSSIIACFSTLNSLNCVKPRLITQIFLTPYLNAIRREISSFLNSTLLP